jgi:hypothetical protein
VLNFKDGHLRQWSRERHGHDGEEFSRFDYELAFNLGQHSV